MRISTITSGGIGVAPRLRRAVIAATAVLALAGGAAALAATGSGGAAFVFVEGGRVTSPYGMRRHPVYGRMMMHNGVDIAAARGAPIAAPDAAVVLQATDLYGGEPRHGKAVVLQFGSGFVALFTHLDSYRVKAGDRLDKGDVFAAVGSSGLSLRPHVHIEVFSSAGARAATPLPPSKRLDPASVWTSLRQ